MKAKRDATCRWFDWKTTDAQLNKLEQHPHFTWRSEQTSIDSIDGYICLVDADCLLYGKEAAVTSHQKQRLPASLMNSLIQKKI